MRRSSENKKTVDLFGNLILNQTHNGPYIRYRRYFQHSIIFIHLLKSIKISVKQEPFCLISGASHVLPHLCQVFPEEQWGRLVCGTSRDNQPMVTTNYGLGNLGIFRYKVGPYDRSKWLAGIEITLLM